MTSTLSELLPLLVSAALVPVEIMVVLVLLSSTRGLLKAIAFILGSTLARLVQGLLFGFVFGSSPDAAGESGGSSPVTSTLLLVLGTLLLVGAYRSLTKSGDPDDQPPQWMQTIGQATPLTAFGYGAVAVCINPKLWVFTLTALGVIREGELAQSESIILYLVFVFCAQLLLILPTLASAVAPRVLTRLSDFMTTYNRHIMLILKLVFGVYFAWKGLGGLLS